MKNLPLLNNKFLLIILFLLFFNVFVSAEEQPDDLWKEKQQTNLEEISLDNEEQNENLIVINDYNDENKGLNILEEERNKSQEVPIGLFDPEDNNFNINMWVNSDGQEINKILKKIDKLKLSKFSKNLLFKVLFTNAYSPNKNITFDEFLDFKINWLIKEQRIKDLENLLEKNSKVGEKTKPIRFLIDEYLSSANVGPACDKAKLLSKDINNNYLDKFNVYCLIYENRNDEAQLVYDLLIERGFKDNFFQSKINYLLGYESKSNNKILDDNLFNFYLSHVTTEDFRYEPNDKTSKYIWQYLSSNNLINTEDLEKMDNEETISLYELAAASGTFKKKEIFNIYKKFLFNIDQYINVTETYKSLPNYKARALVYQTILISDDEEKKIKLAFLLKDLFDKDDIFLAYNEVLSDLLKEINKEEISKDFLPLMDQYTIKEQKSAKKIKFNNKVIHKSKILKYFLEEDYQLKKAEKDVESVLKKIKKDKKYFVSIKDIILLESLRNDGVKFPKGFDYQKDSSVLTTPQSLIDLVDSNQTGLLILKIIEIIGEDKVEDLDPETIYFLSDILNKSNLKEIRNNLISKTLSQR